MFIFANTVREISVKFVYNKLLFFLYSVFGLWNISKLKYYKIGSDFLDSLLRSYIEVYLNF